MKVRKLRGILEWRSLLAMNSKRGGILGGTVLMFVATIVIVLILAIFVLGSGIVKGIDGASAGLRVLNESDVGLSSVISYMNVYHKLVELRFFVESGMSYDEAKMEVYYEE